MEDKILHVFMSLASSLGNWGYLIIFVVTFLESAAFLGLLAPGESMVILAGLLASRGVLDLPAVIVSGIVGATLGDSAGYLLGSRLGEGFFLRYGRHFGIHEEDMADARSFFHRHGGKTVLVARFTTWLRALAPFVAGTVRMPYLRFLFFNAYGAVLWVISLTLLGYLIGNSWRTIETYLGRYGLILLIVGTVLIALFFIFRKKKEKLQRKAGGLDRSLSRQMPALWNFAKNRFRSGPWYGRRLTAGILLLVLCLATLGEVFRSVLREGLFTRLPELAGNFVERIFSPSLTQFMVSAEQVAGIYLTITAASILLAILLWQRRWWLLLVLFLSFFGFAIALAMDFLLKPQRESFPSLEAFAAVVTYGLAIHVVRQTVRGEIKRVVTVSLAVFLIVLTGFSRVYLDADTAPDVLAGFVAGLGWLIFSILLIRTLRQILAGEG